MRKCSLKPTNKKLNIGNLRRNLTKVAWEKKNKVIRITSQPQESFQSQY